MVHDRELTQQRFWLWGFRLFGFLGFLVGWFGFCGLSVWVSRQQCDLCESGPTMKPVWMRRSHDQR